MFSFFRAWILTRRLLRLRIRMVRLAAERVIEARNRQERVLGPSKDPKWARILRCFWGEYLPLWYGLLRIQDPRLELELDPEQISRILGATEPPSHMILNGYSSREYHRKMKKHVALGNKIRTWERDLSSWARSGQGRMPQAPNRGSEVLNLADGGHMGAMLVGWLSPSGLDRRYL